MPPHFSLEEESQSIRSSRPEVFCEKGVLRNFEKTQENTCARVSFLISCRAEACNFIKKEALAQVFSCEFYEISKNIFFTEHLRTTASGI